MNTAQITQLIDIAEAQRRFSYAPYSAYRVGAALLARSGQIYTGCNVENAAYSPSVCAERTAVCKAVSEGVRDFTAICVVGGKNDPPEGFSTPCGICRQTLLEFCRPDFTIIVATDRDNYKMFSLSELMPEGFGPESLRMQPRS